MAGEATPRSDGLDSAPASRSPHPDPHRLRMAMEALRLGQRDDGVGVRRQPGRRIADDAGALHEVVHAERRGVPRGARRSEGRGWARPGSRRPARGCRRRGRSPPRGGCAPGDPLGALGDDLEVLGARRLATSIASRIEGTSDHEAVALQRRPRDRPRGAPAERRLQRRRQRLGERRTVVTHQLDGVLVVLGLGDQVGRDPARAGRCASARMSTSVGPAIMSMPTWPTTWRLASATQRLPGPTILSTRGTVAVPYASARDRLGAADPEDPGDAGERAGREHRVGDAAAAGPPPRSPAPRPPAPAPRS